PRGKCITSAIQPVCEPQRACQTPERYDSGPVGLPRRKRTHVQVVPTAEQRPVYSVYQVFTPTTQARVNYVDRPEINDQFVDAVQTPGKQLIIYGESGSGKSTLLANKLEELYP